MRSALTVRAALEADLPAIAALAPDVRADMPGGSGLVAPDERLLEHLSVLLSAGGHVLVAEQDGQVAGVVLARIVEAFLFAAHPSLYLDVLFVAPGARRHGVGHALLRAATHLAIDHRCENVYSAPMPGHRGAQRFLARLGFAPAAGHRVASAASLQRRLVAYAAARNGVGTRRRFARMGLEDLIARRRRARSMMETGPSAIRTAGSSAQSGPYHPVEIG